MVIKLGEFVGSVWHGLTKFHQLRLIIHHKTGVNVSLAVAVAFVVQDHGAVSLIKDSFFVSYCLLVLQ